MVEALHGEDCLLRGQGPGGWCRAWRAQGHRLGHLDVTAGILIENVKFIDLIILSAGWKKILRCGIGLPLGQGPGGWCRACHARGQRLGHPLCHSSQLLGSNQLY